MSVILSIKPKYVNEIQKGIKKFEFRRAFSHNIRFVYIYSTAPVGKIVGTFEVKRVHHDTPQMLWKKYRDCAGIIESEFFEYFKGVTSGYAIEIKNFQTCKPFDPANLIPNFQPPQSYIYVPKKEETLNKLHEFDHTNC